AACGLKRFRSSSTPGMGGDSGWYWMEQRAARPKNGRPLQNLPPTTHGDFVAAVPSRAFRDGTGILMLELSHYWEWTCLLCRANALEPCAEPIGSYRKKGHFHLAGNLLDG